MNRFLMAAATTVALALPVAAWSANHVVEKQLDAQFIAQNGYSDIEWFASPLTLAPGDSVSLVFTFMPGQRLEMVNPTDLWGVMSMWNDGTSGHGIESSASLSFIGLNGPAHDVGATVFRTAGFGIIAGFSSDEFLNAPGPATISFSGLRYDIAITSYTDGLTQRSFDDAYMVFMADQISAVPEPASALLLGLGGLLLSARRRSPEPAND